MELNLFDMIITDVISYNRINISEGTRRKRKNRPCPALAVKTAGKTVYYHNGKEYLSDSNHICVLPKGADYEFECFEAGECLMVEFTADADFFDFASIEIDRIDEIVKFFDYAEKYAASKAHGWKLRAMYSLYGILTHLSTAFCKKNDEFSLIRPAENYIAGGFRNPAITNDFLASLCSISTVYFRKLFFAYHGISPIAYVNNIRIKKAKELLMGDYQSIEQVSLAVGYNSVYHFSKMFKKKVGISPREFAKGLKN